MKSFLSNTSADGEDELPNTTSNGNDGAKLGTTAKKQLKFNNSNTEDDCGNINIKRGGSSSSSNTATNTTTPNSVLKPGVQRQAWQAKRLDFFDIVALLKTMVRRAYKTFGSYLESPLIVVLDRVEDLQFYEDFNELWCRKRFSKIMRVIYVNPPMEVQQKYAMTLVAQQVRFPTYSVGDMKHILLRVMSEEFPSQNVKPFCDQLPQLITVDTNALTGLISRVDCCASVTILI